MSLKTCSLPGGYIDEDGNLYQECELSPLSGKEEEFLANKEKGNSASLVTFILSRCVRRLGPVHPVSEDIARKLLVADRQYLLLKLREITFGDRVQGSLFCPWPDCNKKVDIEFSTNEIPITESKEKALVYKLKLSKDAAIILDKGKTYREITFRLPNGSDQEAISPHISKNEAEALTMLLIRCIKRIGTFCPPGEKMVNMLSPKARMEIERYMEQLAPKIELNMEAECPECGRGFIAPFDLQGFFFGELRISLDLLYREVHYLAYHYHWSEKEILDMSREKRHKYIDVLSDEIERLNNAL